jgi:hypothetical protein
MAIAWCLPRRQAAWMSAATCSGSTGASGGEVAAVAAHHLDEEDTLVGCRGDTQPVHRFERDVDRRRHADRDVGADQVVVDRGGDADHRQAQAVQCAGTGLRAVAADHHQALDAVGLHARQRLSLASFRLQFDAACRAQHRAATFHDAADVARAEHGEVAGDQAGVAVAHTQHLVAACHAHAHHGADRCIHARRVTATGEHRQACHAASVLRGVFAVRNSRRILPRLVLGKGSSRNSTTRGSL